MQICLKISWKAKRLLQKYTERFHRKCANTLVPMLVMHSSTFTVILEVTKPGYQNNLDFTQKTIVDKVIIIVSQSSLRARSSVRLDQKSPETICSAEKKTYLSLDRALAF